MVAGAAGWAVSRRARLACPDREMSDAATDIVPLADLDAAVRSLDVIPAASTPCRSPISMPRYRSRPQPYRQTELYPFDPSPLTLGAALRPRVLTLTSSNLHPAPGQATSHSLTLTLSP